MKICKTRSCVYCCFFFQLLFVGHWIIIEKSGVAYCVNMYDMCHCIHFCVFDFLHTLASASYSGKYIYGIFLEEVLIF